MNNTCVLLEKSNLDTAQNPNKSRFYGKQFCLHKGNESEFVGADGIKNKGTSSIQVTIRTQLFRYIVKRCTHKLTLGKGSKKR